MVMITKSKVATSKRTTATKSADHQRCKVISKKNGEKYIVEVAGIFSTEIEQKNTVAEIMKRKNIIPTLLKGSKAYQCTQILLVSLPKFSIFT